MVVRPYRHTYAQKEDLERQCVDMLRLSVIGPSESTFSASVLLMKKHDDSWHFASIIAH
jgi:hypothetical protein